MRAVLLLVATLLAPPAGGTAQAQSPLAAEPRAFASRYHEDPPRLDTLYTGLTEALKTDPHLDNFLALAQAAFLWGDIRARTVEEKLAAYERGRQAGQRAVELAPRNALAHLWLAVNAGRWGQTKGVIRSLFLLPTVSETWRRRWSSIPTGPRRLRSRARSTTEVPGLFGGDLEKSEALFRKGLAIDPRFTGARGGLARTLVKRQRVDEARRELERWWRRSAPRNLADWTVKDVKRRARALLAGLWPSARCTSRSRTVPPDGPARPLIGRSSRGCGARRRAGGPPPSRRWRPTPRSLPRAHRLPALPAHQGRDHGPRRRPPLRARRHPGRDARAPDAAQIERAIYPVGFYRTKARVILGMCRDLLERFGGQVPDDIDDLLTLEGRGPKDREPGRDRGLRQAGHLRGRPRPSDLEPLRLRPHADAGGDGDGRSARACRGATGSATTTCWWPSARTSASPCRRAAPPAPWPSLCPRVGVTPLPLSRAHASRARSREASSSRTRASRRVSAGPRGRVRNSPPSST